MYANDAISLDDALMAIAINETLSLIAKRKILEVYIIYKKQNGEIADILNFKS